MTRTSISDIKKELQYVDPAVLLSLCVRLAKYKKENKELLAYLLFESHDEAGYIQQTKEEIDVLFEDVKGRNLYLVKKILRKILRYANRQIKYSSLPETEVALRIYFCEKINAARIPLSTGTVLFNLYQQQLKKIYAALAKLPEDMQSDYAPAIKSIT